MRAVPVQVSAVVVTAYTVYYLARWWLDTPAQERKKQEGDEGEQDEEVLRWCHAEWFEDLDYAIDAEVRAWWEAATRAPGPLVDFLDPELYRMWTQATEEDPRDYADEEIYDIHLQDIATPERHGRGWAHTAVRGRPSPLPSAGAISGRATKAGAGRNSTKEILQLASKARQVAPRGSHGLVAAIIGCLGH